MPGLWEVTAGVCRSQADPMLWASPPRHLSTAGPCASSESLQEAEPEMRGRADLGDPSNRRQWPNQMFACAGSAIPLRLSWKEVRVFKQPGSASSLGWPLGSELAATSSRAGAETFPCSFQAAAPPPVRPSCRLPLDLPQKILPSMFLATYLLSLHFRKGKAQERVRH